MLNITRINKGEKVQVLASFDGGSSSVQCAVYYRKKSASVWVKAQDYSDNMQVKIKPSATGEYLIRVKLKDSTGKVVQKDLPLIVRKKQ